jgi:DegV family protein with EDD domain
MPRIAIITDTDSSLPKLLADQYKIPQVPINVHFGNETLAAVDELDDARLFERIDKEGKLPSTSAPSPGKFAQAYQKAFDDGYDEVLCFTVSSKVSAVYNAALTACDLLPGKPIRVVDTESLSMAQGFIVLAAAEAAQAGSSSQEIIQHALDIGNRTRLYAALATLRYLAMSGRVGHLAASIGGLLDVRPILTLREGKLDLLERARTQKKAWDRVIELTRQAVDGKKIERLAILNVNAADNALSFKGQLCSAIGCPDDSVIVDLTPGLSVHSGSGMVGVVFVVEQ